MRAAASIVLMCCAVAFAQPETALVAELATLERSASNQALSLRERESAVDQAIDVRRRLISSARDDDPRLAGWLLDQSAAILSRLGRDGSDTAVLFALPTPAQRESARSAAGESANLLARAADLIRKSEGGAEDERAVRAGFLRGRAEVILAALEEGEPRRAHAASATASIGKVAFTAPGPEAIRRVITGAALLMRASSPTVEDVQLALEEFAWAALGGEKPDEPAPGISSATRVEGWLGLLHAAGALGNASAAAERLKQAMREHPFARDGRADPLFAVLATDALTRVFFEQGLARGDRAMLQRSIEEQLALLAREDLGFRADALRPAAFDKLAALADTATAPDELPAGFALARAIRAARDPQQRGSATEAFEAIAVREDSGMFAADAIWEAAVLLLQAGSDFQELRRGIAHLIRLARDHPEHARAAEGMAAALAYAKQHAETAPQPEVSTALALYAEALTLATERYPALPEIDLWRYERGRIALAGRAPEQEMQAALRSLRRIAHPSPDAIRLTERLQASVLESIRLRFQEARARGEAGRARTIAATELEPEARTASEWARAAGSIYKDRFDADLADAMTDAGRPDGRLIYQELLKHAPSEAVPGGHPRLKLGLARSILNAGKTREAFPYLREVAAALDAPSRDAGAPARSEDFWHAWTLMLEILADEASGNPEKLGAIRAHIRRLESVDRELGGRPWSQRIGMVRERAN